jgi:hypothetical protein
VDLPTVLSYVAVVLVVKIAEVVGETIWEEVRSMFVHRCHEKHLKDVVVDDAKQHCCYSEKCPPTIP